MSFANINIGTTPGDHSGDPLRTAFNKINNNFQQIANGTVSLTVNAPVKSVAGRTGNVVITVNDVIGAVTSGDVQAAMADFSAGYVTKTDLNSNVSALLGGAPSNLNTLNKLATSLGNSATFSADVATSLNSVNAQISQLWSNAVVQTSTLELLSDEIVAANVAIAQNASNIQILFANAATQSAALATLTSNAASQASDLITLTANAASQGASLSTLSSNAAAQDSSLSNLLANAAVQDTSLTVLLANAVSQQSSLTALLANTGVLQNEIAGANAAIVTANTALKGYVDVQISAVNQAWGANAQSVQSQFTATNAAIITANTSLKSYVDTSNSSMKGYVDAQNTAIVTEWTSNAATQSSQITGANAAIVTANTALKSYVDAQNTAISSAWSANAATQAGQITTLQGQVYSNSNVAAYLPNYTGNIGGGNLNLSGNVLALGAITSRHQIKGLTTMGSYVDGAQTALLTLNATASQPTSTAATLHVIGPVTGTPVQIALDAHSSTVAPVVLARRTRGNVSVPTALQSADIIGSFSAKGYGSTGWSTATAPGLSIFAAETFTDVAQGTYAVITNTVPGSLNVVYHTRFDSNGNLVIVNGSTSTSPTTGALVVGGGAGVGGNVHASGDIRALGNLYATNGSTSSVSTNNVYANRYYFANNAPFSLPYDISSADAHIRTYGGNAYVANVQMYSSTFTGDGSNLPLTFDFTQVIANHSIQAEGTIVANASTQATSAYNGALTVPNGGAGIQGNLFVAIQPSTRLQVGQGGTYFGNVIAQFTSDQDGPGQINMQNIRTSANAASEIVASADNGTQYTHYMKMGICNSIYNSSVRTGYYPLDGYVNADGGNLIISAERLGTTIKFMNGGYSTANVVGTWDSNVLTVSTKMTLTSAIQFANLTTSQVDAISTPQPGMTVYNYTSGNIQVYNGTKWANVTLS